MSKHYCVVTVDDLIEVSHHRSDVCQINIEEAGWRASVQLSYVDVNNLIEDLKCWKESHNGTGKFK